ncbi:MAG: FliO/MopB family protein [Verrucomicrobiia bacterium]|jgi:flagellar biogenesis protein FliO
MKEMVIKYASLTLKQMRDKLSFLFLFIGSHSFGAENFTNYNSFPVQNVPDVSGSILRLFGAFIFVIGLFLIGAWFFKNWRGVIATEGRKSHLKIIEVKHIGSRQALFVVGYKSKRMLIGVSQSNINLVSNLPDDDEAEKQDETPSFVSIINKLSPTK